MATKDEPQGYAGEELGMPASGPGSMAPLWRRAVGLLIDWVLAQVLAVVAFGAELGAGGAQSFVPLGVLAVLNLLCVTAFAATPGHALMRLQVLQVRPGSFPLQVLIRTTLLCLFVPAVLQDAHGRGLHDAAAGTVIVRR
ncbi:transporter [Knoellia sinensis KCTC 19936]|uniref:Transporter n=1 Tax=Knoellia sinensis KCTC 19936 TaxID=1385520 RepID=A0A0A0J7I4_9MICO|nr:RDD family protein [Knoellia sinensis]KGN33138.1 transporter [Knoellia sinensis KCTC 19936]